MTFNIRRTSRAIILNSNNQILLLKINDKPLQSKKYRDQKSFWVTVGGAVEPNESAEEALKRELREEVGIKNVIKVELIAFGEQVLPWKGLQTQFIEQFFIVRTDEIYLNDRNLTQEEIELINEYRWWSIDEMLATEEVIFPGCLARLVVEYINHSDKWMALKISLD